MMGGGNNEGEAKKDSQGRYLVCVGPRIFYKKYSDLDKLEKEDLSGFSRHIQVELEHKTDGSKKIFNCYVENLKAHSYSKYPDNHSDVSLSTASASFPNLENGIVQTGIRYPNASNPIVASRDYADSSVIEFSGETFSDFNLRDYRLIRVLSNTQRTDLFIETA
jgi:hypothetical protein